MKNENSWGFVDATNTSMAFTKTGYLPQNIYTAMHWVAIYISACKCPPRSDRKKKNGVSLRCKCS